MTCPPRRTRPPGAGSTPGARGGRRPCCDTERPQLRQLDLAGVSPSRRVACHWVEQIEAGEITPHAVAATATEQRDLSQDKGDFLGPASVTEAL